MIEIIEIPIYLRQQNNGLLFIPFDVVKVPKGSKVNWIIVKDKGFDSFLSRSYKFIELQIYFDDKSPFSWKTYNSPTISRSLPISKDFTFGNGKVEEPGDYKYGIKAIDIIENSIIDDEDPHLIVF